MVYFTQNRLLCSATTPTLYSALGDIIIRRIKTMATKQEIIAKFQLHEGDTGSPEVQIALLTNRINHLNEHLKEHKKDHHSSNDRFETVGQRRGLLNYLKETDIERYRAILAELNLRK